MYAAPGESLRTAVDGTGDDAGAVHDRTVPELFEDRVRRDPNAIAVSDSAGAAERRITFGDLNAHANRVAASLVDAVGPGPGRVAIVLDDDIGVVASMLGVMKAGKTFVPLDAGNPQGRLSGLFEHARVEAVVRDRAEIAELTAAPTFSFDEMTAAGSTENLGLDIDPNAPVRIMYTSGSTGRPKGVVHSHAYLMQKTSADRTFLEFTQADRLSQTLPLNFAASTGHTFGALLSGATLGLYDPLAHGVHGFADWIEAEGITGLLLVPALLRRFLESQAPGTIFPTVRYVMVGGDRVTHRDVDLYRRHFSKEAVFIHRFAATECGPIARFVIESGDEIPETILPIGYPTAGRSVLVLDEERNEVEPGRIGEMHLQAYDLADGYWDEPELTAAAFRPGPDGSRIFRTGDLGRLSPQGYLEHLGRKDQRIKVHGFGVDILEVEKALLGHPQIGEAVVTARSVENDETSLTGYVVGEGDVDLETADLRSYLGDLLPTYSIPAHLVVLDQMPLTARGKIDRSALPEPVAKVRTTTPPVDQVERNIVSVWEETLGITGIGVTDDFFELGGTSVQALEVFAVMADRFDYALAPSTLFQAPTIGLLAKRIRAGESPATGGSLIQIRSSGAMPPIFFVHGGGGGVFFAREIAQYLRPDRPVYGIQAAGFESAAPPQRTVEELAGIYAAEIRALDPEGPYLLAGLSFGGLIAIEMSRVLAAAGAKTDLVVLLDTKHPSVAKGEAEDVDRHTRRMADMSLVDRARYVASGAWKRSVRRPLRRRRIDRYVRAGEPIPIEDNLRNAYFWSIHAKASRAYRVEPIDAPLLIIGEEGSSEEHGRLWTPLAADTIEITEVHGDHNSLAREPVVAEVAEVLQAAIDGATEL